MKIAAFGLSDVGKQRQKNEDSFLVKNDLSLFAVCDGMGGHQGGDYASLEAVDILEEIVSTIEKDPKKALEGANELNPDDFPSRLKYALKLASRKIYEKSVSNAELKGMGTTAVVLYFRNNKVYIANVGDSRAYRVRSGRIVQITTDHSLVNEQLKAGVITKEEARGHKLKNIITRSVGFQQDVEVDVDVRAVLKEDLFILCSDGLSNMLPDNEIMKITKGENDLAVICRKLIDLANEKGGDDNITAVVVRVDELDEMKEGDVEDSTVEA
ncbi:MAG: Stp1/IreP family PP2C-type Ser/Thr phosphatase [Pseudomonadota bacterium]